MSSDLPERRARFLRALRVVGAAPDGSAIFDDLVARYQQPHRHYHTLVHVDSCLAWLDRFCANAERPAEVELALWFHDVVYEPQRKDNELRSAQLAGACLRGLEVSRATADRISNYVKATDGHVPTCGDSALVIDIDLAILGAAPHVFYSFERQIRQEYAHVPEPLYRLGRCRVLKRFLSRREIYSVPAIRVVLEAPARVNLERRVGELSRWFR